MTTASRLTSTGTLFISGEFDEVTQSTIKNLLTYTEQFNQSVWTKTRSSIGAIDTVSAPNGTLTADKLVEDTATGSHTVRNATALTITSGTTLTASVYSKAAEGGYVIVGIGDGGGVNISRSTFNLSTGAILNITTAPANISAPSPVITPVGNGWYRCSVTATVTGVTTAQQWIFKGANSNGNASYTGDGVSGIYIWGAQTEIGSSLTPYQGIGATSVIVTPDYAVKVLPTGIRAAGFDEVSIYGGAVAKRETSTGTLLVSNRFDEVTGMIVTNGLLAYYDAGKAASQPATGATWLDISDNRINAATSASPPTFNSAGYFTLSALNSQRFLTTALAPTTWAESWTIEVWMYTPTGAVWGNGVNRSHHIAIGSTAGTWGIIRYPTDNQMTTWVRGAAEFTETARATLARDRWHQFVGTWDGINTVSSYLNGSFVGSATITLTGAPDTGSLLIGGTNSSTISGSPGTYYDGNIAAVMMYNRALSTAEVSNNFEALRDRFGI